MSLVILGSKMYAEYVNQYVEYPHYKNICYEVINETEINFDKLSFSYALTDEKLQDHRIFEGMFLLVQKTP